MSGAIRIRSSTPARWLGQHAICSPWEPDSKIVMELLAWADLERRSPRAYREGQDSFWDHQSIGNATMMYPVSQTQQRVRGRLRVWVRSQTSAYIVALPNWPAMRTIRAQHCAHSLSRCFNISCGESGTSLDMCCHVSSTLNEHCRKAACLLWWSSEPSVGRQTTAPN